MYSIIKQKRPFQPIRVVQTITYRQRGLMITIGRIPKKLEKFFKPIKREVSSHVFKYFWGLTLGICIGHGSTIERLVNLLRNPTHRTNHGEFLWRSQWDESWVVQAIALDTLKRLYRKKCRDCFFIIDDTQTIKRAKKMQAVGKIHHHASGKYCMGHTILKVCLYYRGVIIPWGSWLYVKKEHAKKLKVPFRKLTELAAETIVKAEIPEIYRVTVLFDAYYLCPKIVNTCKERNWYFIGVGKKNRRFTVGAVERKISKYGRNVLKSSGKWHTVTGLRKTGRCLLTQRKGTMPKLGDVRVIFSRRQGDSNFISLVTNNQGVSIKKIVADYLKRWSIEVMIKDQKQHLGLGDYRVLRYEAIVRHLCLVDCAYACLTHVGLSGQHAKGQNNTKHVLSLEPISKLKTQMRQMIWQEEVKNVIKVSHEKKVIRRLEKLLAA